MRRQRLLYASLLLISIAISACYFYIPPRDNAFVGSTKQQIVQKLGNPTTQFAGHYGNPPSAWADQHPNCVTLVYQKPDGTLYVTIESKNGDWIGLCSQWLPKGGAF